MSTLLEQAIIDASALRETAMKSAEASLIEKYSKEFKDTVEKLLEQEVAPETAAANAEDPTGPTVSDPDPSQNFSADPLQQDTTGKDTFKNVKSAFFNLDGDDDDLITINFDQLKAKPLNNVSSLIQPPPSALMSQPSTQPEVDQSQNLSEDLEIDLKELSESLKIKIGEDYDNPGTSYHRSQAEEEEEEEEEFEFELDEAEQQDPTVKSQRDAAASQRARADKLGSDRAKALEAAGKADALANKAEKDSQKKKTDQNSSQQQDMYEEIQLTEDELNELEESLKVDMENVSDGYMGSTKRKAREFKKVAYAKARDTAEEKRRENAKKKLSDLQEALEYATELFIKEKQKTNSLENTNENLLKAVETLKEQLEKINLSNAKLLYTNKVLSNNSLNERQKNQVVENLTRASSVSEAKTIFETLQSAVQSVQEKTPKSLSEAINRGSAPFLVRKTQTASINDLMSERMKLLAGIKQN